MTTDSPIKFPEQRRAAVRALLVDTATSEADRRALARPPRRRAVTAVLATVAVLSGGLSIAAAAGVPIVPKAVLEVFGWQPGPGEYNPKPDTARLLLTTTGPHRQPMQLWYADASDHGYCTADIEGTNLPTSPSPGELSGRQPAGDSWRYLAAGCDGPIGGSEWREFGGKCRRVGQPCFKHGGRRRVRQPALDGLARWAVSDNTSHTQVGDNGAPLLVV